MLNNNNTTLTNLVQRIKEEYDIANNASYSSQNCDYWLGRFAVTKELLNFFDDQNPKGTEYGIYRKSALTENKLTVK